jgi:hypothetical protein
LVLESPAAPLKAVDESIPESETLLEISAEMPVVSSEKQEIDPPLTGVEVIGTERRRGTQYHMMRDLRNGNLIHNVTRSSARRLWHYAITQAEDKAFNENEVQWNGSIGLIRRYKKAGAVRYDLAQRVSDASGKTRIRVYYGVTEDGMPGAWAGFISEEDAPEDGA